MDFNWQGGFGGIGQSLLRNQFPVVDQLYSIAPCGTLANYDNWAGPVLVLIDTQGQAIVARRMYVRCRTPAAVGAAVIYAIALYRLRSSGGPGSRESPLTTGTGKELDLVPNTIGYRSVAPLGGPSDNYGTVQATFQEDIILSPQVQHYVAIAANNTAGQVWCPLDFDAFPFAGPVNRFSATGVTVANFPQSLTVGSAVPFMPYVLFRSARGIWVYGSRDIEL